MNQHEGCPGCAFLRLAMVGLPDFVDPMDLVSAVAYTAPEKDAVGIENLVVIVGAHGLGLPSPENVSGPFLLGVQTRGDILEYVKGNPEWESLTEKLRDPPEHGKVWILGAIKNGEKGLVVCINHSLPVPSQLAFMAVVGSMLPKGGESNPMRWMSPGGSA